MVNGVYDPETENEKGGFWKPDPGHDEPSGDSSDPQEKDTDNLDDIRDSEADGAGGDTPTDKSDGSKSLANAEHSATSDGGGLYNGAKDTNKPGLFGVNKRTARTAGVIISLLVAIFGAIMSLSPFNLANFMANVEQRGFARYQVDMRGRSREWLQAYMELRFAEVEDKNLAPKDRKNLYFRSNVISSNPVKEWFLQLRGTGQFEQDMFEKHGIKFTSVAYQDGNIVKYRPGVMTLKNTNERLTFDPSQAAITAIQNGDPNAFNGELDKFINVKVLKNDKAGRQAIAQLLKDEYPHWWQAIKRYHMRQDIQRMIGVRNWRLFENKRQAVTEKGMALRNSVVQKVVDNALPEDSKSGKFIECLFGLSNCSASSDVANPDNRAYSPDGSTKQPDKTAKSDSGSGDVSVNDGSGSKKLQSVVETATISREAIAKLFKGANILSIIDSLAKFDKAVRNHKISKLVSQIKLQYVVGLYTTFKIADDQHKTGEMSSQEFGAFMQQYNGLTNGEGWTSVTNPGSSSGTASADSLTSSPFTAAKDKQEYCSQQHQDAMDDPNNVDAARKEFAYMCDKDIVGSAKNISFFENAWNNGPGAVLHPVLAAFESTAGFIVNIFNSVTGAVSSALLSLSGLDGTVQSVVGWGASKAVEIAGANMDVGVNTPPGRVGNLIMEGGAGLGEASMRDQGGALTTNVTRAEATQNYIAYQQEEAASSSFT
ncbi:MAG: hypothetical protein ACXWLH_06475, partial [Candidatus Saccharimonadales bacterium]